jgi:3-methyladenine DNA glycosylase/8-oxoguanine DNA glycosylase
VAAVEVEVRPRWPFRMPRWGGHDGLLRVRGATARRLLCVEGAPVVASATQTAADRVVFSARGADREVAGYAIERLRFALGVDDDLRPFHERFRWDPLIGRALRADPRRRALRRARPFEALAFAVCEQLIDSPRAGAIQRRMVARLGERCPETGLRDAPDASRVAGASSALLQSMDLSGGRARALVRAAREVARGRIDLDGADVEAGWRRLRAIPGIGSWTVEMLALTGQGRLDQVPAGDLNYRKLVARLRTGSPHARAEEDEVREFFAPYAPWGGMAAAYLGGSVARGGA